MAPVQYQPLPKRPRKKRKNGEGSVYFVANRNKYCAAVYNVNGLRRTKTFEKVEDAWKWLSEENQAKHLGSSTLSANPNLLLKDFLLDWVNRNRYSKKPNTTKSYLGRITNQVIPHIGHIKVADVNPRLITNFMATLIESGLGPGTVLGTYRTLSAAFREGVDLRELPINPMGGCKKPRLKPKPQEPIPSIDATIIYSHASQNPYMHARVELGLVCGLRPGEVLGLLWSDIDWELGILKVARQVQSVRGKGLVFQSVKQDEERNIHLSDYQLDILRNHKMAQNQVRKNFIEDEGLIFPNLLGKKLDHRRDDRNWKALLRKAGVPKYSRYQMRKTAFTNLQANLKDIKKVMAYSGHKQVSTLLNSYLFVTDDYKNEIRRSVDESRPKLLKEIPDSKNAVNTENKPSL
jgi:integrase